MSQLIIRGKSDIHWCACPLLFHIYINGLPDSLSYFDMLLYADDTSLLIAYSITNPIFFMFNKDLIIQTQQWKYSNLLLSSRKENMLIFIPPRKALLEQLAHLSLNGFIIPPSTHTRLLGVLTDHNLTFKRKQGRQDVVTSIRGGWKISG